MMLRAMVAATAAGAGLAAFAVQAEAFDHGCSSRAVECYEKVRKPDVYATVERPVVVAPGRREVIHTPAVIEPRPYRVGPAYSIRTEHVPAVYSTVMRRQLVQPASVSYVHQPAVVQRVHQTVVAHPGGVRWERQVDRHGVERMCKIHVPAVTSTVARDVVVSPARRVAVETPAVYHEVAVPVLVSPARTRHVSVPAPYAVAYRPTVLKAASIVVVDHPPVIGVERQRVLVQSGGSTWQRSHDHHW